VVGIWYFSYPVAAGQTEVSFQFLATFFGVFAGLILAEWFRMEDRADVARGLRKDLCRELELMRQSVKARWSQLFFIDTWETACSTGEISNLTRAERTAFSVIFTEARRYIKRLEMYHQARTFNVPKATLKEEETWLNTMGNELDQHIQTFLENNYPEK
ncbi:MAG: hypothetical protein PVI03_01365, partial [Candidatus Thorarchaeota archaeon]